MNKLSLIGSCQQVVIIILKCHYKSRDRSAARFALHRAISLSRVIVLAVLFAALQVHGRFSVRGYTRTSLTL